MDAERTSTTAPAFPDTPYKSLRVWPVVLLFLLAIALRALPSIVEDGPSNLWMSAAFGPMICSLLVLIFWLAASRATWRERLVGFFGLVFAVVAAVVGSDPSMRGPATLVLTVPLGVGAFAIGIFLCRNMLSFRRTWIALMLAICGLAFTILLRTDGMWGDFSLGMDWRWNRSPEQIMMATRDRPSDESKALSPDSLRESLSNPEWPEFRGRNRDGRQPDTSITVDADTDWSTDPPELLWKIPVGPGWSSFAVAGNLLYTQEQRGTMECVCCYDANTGQEVWTQHMEVRFEEPIGGPGPRATPTISGDGLYVMGADGLLMRLAPGTGEMKWKQDLKQVANRTPPMWGFSSSPLVVGSLVIVHAGGAGDKGTLAFDKESGELRWTSAAGDHSYSSPQLCTVLGDPTVAVLTNAGLDLLDPVSGAARLNYPWQHEGYRVLQPQMIEDSFLLPTGMGTGTRRIRVASGPSGWTAEELWTSRDLKPDYNDFVIDQGHAYGFDGLLFTCIDLNTGKRTWKGGRYGKGQVLLLANTGHLIVASEKGDIVLLAADPKKHTEITRFAAIEGKTWNHPVVVGDHLFVRNGQEAACFRLPTNASSASHRE